MQRAGELAAILRGGTVTATARATWSCSCVRRRITDSSEDVALIIPPHGCREHAPELFQKHWDLNAQFIVSMDFAQSPHIPPPRDVFMTATDANGTTTTKGPLTAEEAHFAWLAFHRQDQQELELESEPA